MGPSHSPLWHDHHDPCGVIFVIESKQTYCLPSSSFANCLLIAASTLLEREYSVIKAEEIVTHFFLLCLLISSSVVFAMSLSLLYIMEVILPFSLEFSRTVKTGWPIYRYKEELYIMAEQTSDGMPTPIGGICQQCGRPCCLQESCSTVSENG